MVVMIQTKAPFPQTSPQVNVSVFLWFCINNSNKVFSILCSCCVQCQDVIHLMMRL